MSTAVLASLKGTSVRRDVLDFVGPESTLRPNFWTRNLVGCSGDVDEGGFRTDRGNECCTWASLQVKISRKGGAYATRLDQRPATRTHVYRDTSRWRGCQGRARHALRRVAESGAHTSEQGVRYWEEFPGSDATAAKCSVSLRARLFSTPSPIVVSEVLGPARLLGVRKGMVLRSVDGSSMIGANLPDVGIALHGASESSPVRLTFTSYENVVHLRNRSSSLAESPQHSRATFRNTLGIGAVIAVLSL
ncbi:PDZ domain [Phytophthora cactorum]|nr:PDZ domain [Phytophthora cactorum]